MTHIEPSVNRALLDLDQHARESMDTYVRIIRIAEELTQAILRELDEPTLANNIPFIILVGLHLDGPLRPTAITKLTGLSSGGVSGVLERMEDRGLLVREFGGVAGDRRGVVVRLTDKGRANALAIGELLDGIIERLFVDLARAIRLRRRRGLPVPGSEASLAPSGPAAELVVRMRENLSVFLRLVAMGQRLHEETLASVGAYEYDANVSLISLYGLLVHGALRPSEIQAMTGLTSGGVSGLLERLEILGIVTRDYGMVPGDRRGVTVRLTDKGHRDMLVVVQLRAQAVEQLLGELASVIESRAGRRAAASAD
jgi:DNA-binding MarR family transcriptional regulator